MNCLLTRIILVGNTNTGKSRFLKNIDKRLQIHSDYSETTETKDDNEKRHYYPSIDELETFYKDTIENDNILSTQNTIGVQFFHKLFLYQDKIIKMYFWDLSGMKRFRQIVYHYLNLGACVVYFFNVHDMKSFRDIKTWIELVKERVCEKGWGDDKSRVGSRDKDCRYTLLIGNIKKNRERIISYDEALLFSQKHNLDYLEFHDDKETTETICRLIIKNILDIDNQVNSCKNKQKIQYIQHVTLDNYEFDKSLLSSQLQQGHIIHHNKNTHVMKKPKNNDTLQIKNNNNNKINFKSCIYCFFNIFGEKQIGSDGSNDNLLEFYNLSDGLWDSSLSKSSI